VTHKNYRWEKCRTQLGVKMHCAKNKLPANCTVEVFATNIRFIHWEGGEKKQHISIRGQGNLKVHKHEIILNFFLI
jgi:hypothetical protein